MIKSVRNTTKFQLGYKFRAFIASATKIIFALVQMRK